MSPFGTPSCSSESGPRRYSVSGLGASWAAGAEPNITSVNDVAAASTRTDEMIVSNVEEVKTRGRGDGAFLLRFGRRVRVHSFRRQLTTCFSWWYNPPNFWNRFQEVRSGTAPAIQRA